VFQYFESKDLGPRFPSLEFSRILLKPQWGSIHKLKMLAEDFKMLRSGAQVAFTTYHSYVYIHNGKVEEATTMKQQLSLGEIVMISMDRYGR